MRLFRARRNPADPRQQQVAIHELGHAYTWLDVGLLVRTVTHQVDTGACELDNYPSQPTHPMCQFCPADPDQLYAFAVGCWGGFEAETPVVAASGTRPA